MTHVFMVVFTCVWAGSLNVPSYSCNEAHLHQPTPPALNLGGAKVDLKTREALENIFSPISLCKDIADAIMENHYGDSDPKPDGHIRVLKRYCQLEHNGPSYIVDLRTGQITVSSP